MRDRPVAEPQGDGFLVVEDSEVSLVSKGACKLPMRLRRLRVQREEGDAITLLTNDLERCAVEIGQLYKGRWQIELLFRWIKQHLKIRKFLGNNGNAIRLQLFAAMVAFAAAAHCRAHPPRHYSNLEVHRTGRSILVRAAENAHHRQAATGQSKPTKRPSLSQSDGFHI